MRENGIVIPPHITKNDAFGKALIRALREFKPQNILDIGASYGEGSTQLFYDHSKADIYAIELTDQRFLRLKDRFPDRVKAYNVGTCPNVMSKARLKWFYENQRGWDCWATFTFEQMEDWRQQQKARLKVSDAKGIETIRRENDIQSFDFVLIDGGPFTGLCELDAVWGSSVIALDDIMDIKNFDAYQKIRKSNYKPYEVNQHFRNGYAIFTL